MTPTTVVYWIYTWTRIICDVLFQKLLNLGVPELADVGGPVKGLVALVTGPTSGIGRVTAVELGRRGATGARKSNICTNCSIKTSCVAAPWDLCDWYPQAPVLQHELLTGFLAKSHHTLAVILACRDAAKGQEVSREVEEAQKTAGMKPSVVVESLDLSDMASIVRCADSVKASGRPLHLLVNNGGIFDLSGTGIPLLMMPPCCC